jgi:hypothetical protein
MINVYYNGKAVLEWDKIFRADDLTIKQEYKMEMAVKEEEKAVSIIVNDKYGQVGKKRSWKKRSWKNYNWKKNFKNPINKRVLNTVPDKESDSIKESQVIIQNDEVMSKNSFDKNQYLQLVQNEIDSLEEEQKEKNSFDLAEEIEEGNKKLDHLYNELPLGPSFLHKKDVEKLIGLSKVSSEPTYRDQNGKMFYEPQVSQLDLTQFFLRYASQMNYSGVTINKITDHYYTYKKKGCMFTSVTFTKKTKNVPNFFGDSFQQPDHNSIFELKKELNRQLSQWNFEYFESNLIEKADFYNDLVDKIPSIKNFGYYFLLFHKEVQENHSN